MTGAALSESRKAEEEGGEEGRGAATARTMERMMVGRREMRLDGQTMIVC